MKNSPHYKNLKKANKVNNEVKLNIDKQQDDIKNIQKNMLIKGCVYNM